MGDVGGHRGNTVQITTCVIDFFDHSHTEEFSAKTISEKPIFYSPYKYGGNVLCPGMNS